MLPKTVLFISDLLDGMGGAEKNLFLLATHLKTTRHTVVVACLKGGLLSDDLVKDGIEVIDLDITKLYGAAGIKSIINLMMIVKQRKVDVVMTYHLGSDCIGGLLSLFLRIPVISNRRDMGFDLQPRHYLYYRLLNPLFSHICAVSHSVKNMLINRQNVNGNKITVIKNGVDVSIFEDMNGKKILNLGHQNVVNICCVANIREIKGHKYLIKAMAEVLNNDVNCQLFLVGYYDEKDPIYKELMDLIAAAGIGEKIIFLGPKNPELILSVMRKMDISVLPSLSEGMSNTLIESMAAKLPVVATNVGGNPEVVVDGETGFLVPPKDPGMFAAALLKLITNVELRRKMGDAGYKLFKDDFSAPIMLSKYEKIFQYVFVRKINTTATDF